MLDIINKYRSNSNKLKGLHEFTVTEAHNDTSQGICLGDRPARQRRRDDVALTRLGVELKPVICDVDSEGRCSIVSSVYILIHHRGGVRSLSFPLIYSGNSLSCYS